MYDFIGICLIKISALQIIDRQGVGRSDNINAINHPGVKPTNSERRSERRQKDNVYFLRFPFSCEITRIDNCW
jgi:hypothetical protein